MPVGRINPGYKPFANWKVYSKPVAGEMTWFADFGTTAGYYIGVEKQSPPYAGLVRRAAAANPDIPYDHEHYRPRFGEWASFLYPTAQCESDARFLVINAWDTAAITFGFFQMAAHTGEHLANLFRELIAALPAEATQFYPELKLGSQIGRTPPAHIFAVEGTNAIDLDVIASPVDGLPSERNPRGKFMDFFNANRGKLELDEVTSAARWIAWMKSSAAARDVCVLNAVNTAKTAVRRVHKYVGDQHHPDFPKGLDGVSMDLVAACMDVKHHGRHNEGEKTDQSIFAALTNSDQFGAFRIIGRKPGQLARSKRDVEQIRNMSAWFKSKTYDAANENFH